MKEVTVEAELDLAARSGRGGNGGNGGGNGEWRWRRSWWRRRTRGTWRRGKGRRSGRTRWRARTIGVVAVILDTASVAGMEVVAATAVGMAAGMADLAAATAVAATVGMAAAE